MSENVTPTVSLWDMYHTDRSAEEEGTPVEFAPGVVVTIRSDAAQKVRAFENSQMRKQRALIARNGGFLPPEVLDANETEMLASAGIVSWAGVVDREGKELPCTPENIRRICKDLPRFRSDIRSAMRMTETFRAQAIEDVRGNSSPPSKKS